MLNTSGRQPLLIPPYGISLIDSQKKKKKKNQNKTKGRRRRRSKLKYYVSKIFWTPFGLNSFWPGSLDGFASTKFGSTTLSLCTHSDHCFGEKNVVYTVLELKVLMALERCSFCWWVCWGLCMSFIAVKDTGMTDWKKEKRKKRRGTWPNPSAIKQKPNIQYLELDQVKIDF